MDANIREIELAIDALTPLQREELFSRLDQQHTKEIEAQLEIDMKAGRFDDRINRVLADHKSGNTKTL